MPFYPNSFYLRTPFNGEVQAPFVGVLDGFTAGLKGVWDIKRRLLASHTGSAFLCRADRSGQPTREIGYLADGTWDTDSLLAFAGTDSVYLVTPTEQSGNGLVLTQTDAALQPRLVNNGVLEADGPYFDGLNDFLKIASMDVLDFLGPTASHIYTRCKVADFSGNFRAFDMTEQKCSLWLPYSDGSVYVDIPYLDGRFSSAAPSGLIGNLRDISCERNSTTGKFRMDGTTEFTGTVTATNASATVEFSVGADVGGNSLFKGNISSLVVWNTADDTTCTERNSALE